MTRRSPGPRWETPDPPGVKGSYGPRVRQWAKRELGITFGPWQTRAIDKALRYDARGDLIHRIVLFSTARQNGKSVIVRAFYGWMLDEGQHLEPFRAWRTLLAAAHDAKQARIIYRGVYSDLDSIERLHEMAREATRRKMVRLTEHFGIQIGDLTLDTVTGQPGSARGLSAGAVAWDEMLTQRGWMMWEALSPTQSAQRSPIMVLTSSAGMRDSVVLRAFYDRLVRQASGDEKPDPAFYGAWWQSTDPDAGLDWDQVAMANPALGDGRLVKAAIEGEYRILPPDSWRRERMNHWIDAVAAGAFHPGLWAACRAEKPMEGLDGPFALGVDVHPGWERATISVAAMRPDGRVGGAVVRDIRDGGITADRVIAEVVAFPAQPMGVFYDQQSALAPRIRQHAAETGFPWVELKSADVTAACMDFGEMIQSARLAVDDPLLDAQVAGTAKRAVGQDGAYRFNRAGSLGPIDAVMSMTFAAHGIAGQGSAPQVF